MIGTKNWWKQQLSLIAVLLGLLTICGNLLLFIEYRSFDVVVFILIGAGLVIVGGITWRRYERRHSVEQLEQQIFGPD